MVQPPIKLSAIRSEHFIFVSKIVKPQRHVPSASVIIMMLAGLFVALIWLSISPATARANHPAPLPLALPCTTVNNTNDSGTNSLRDAVACVQSGGTITFNSSLANQTILLTTTEIFVTQTNITIDGSNAPGVMVDGNNASRVFTISAPISIISLTIQNGNVTGEGGGLYAANAVTLTNVSFLTNTANGGSAYYGGGGAYFGGPAHVTATTFTGNTTANFGGGAAFGGTANVTATTFTGNTAYHDGGGAVFFRVANVTATTFTGNTSAHIAGGAAFAVTAYVTATTFTNNTAVLGGGGAYFNGPAHVTATTFTGNTTANFGGGAVFWDTANVTATTFTGNTAYSGGGLVHTYTGDGQFVNALFARNVASSTLGADLYLDSPGSVQILYTTIASPTLSSGSAIFIDNGTVGITDTIISNYAVGIQQTGGTVFENYNLFFGNITNTFGTFLTGSGTKNVIGDPKFVNAASGNYHLQFGSAAIGRAINVGVNIDLDGNSRPGITGFDIGAYQYQYAGVLFRVYLPLTLKNF
jgi:predicted outer membrane repeat protein